jgi:hypothetical protein
MAVQLTIEFDKLVELVDQLPDEQQLNLVQHVLQRPKDRTLTPQEKIELLNSTVHDLGSIPVDFSFSREDWYGDDGR